MSNKTTIRDPIHNYIYLTYVEENVVEHSLFQRLRFISQNGSAYYTYPSNRHCRFLHSLGVMKLGGDIFLNSTEDINDPDVKEYLKKALALIDAEITQTFFTTFDSVITTFFDKKNIAYIKYGLDIDLSLDEMKKEVKKGVNSNYVLKFVRLILFQSLRLACLLHDIGHFPFSHTVEYAFKDYLSSLKNKSNKSEPLNEEEETFLSNYSNLITYVKIGPEKEIHELIGIKILQEVLPSSHDDFQKLCRKLARFIITKEKSDEGFEILNTLHDVVSGELDADRLDYSLRDPYSSGLDLGRFDIERLLNNFTMVQENGDFKILPKMQSLSSIECFFHQRYLAYKYLIYHHSKVRMDVIIKEITSMLICIYFSGKHEHSDIIEVLEKNNFKYLWSKLTGISDQGNENYLFCDENWYKSLLNELYAKREIIKNEDPYVRKLILLVETFTLRKTNNIISILKRYDKYLDFLEKIRNIFDESLNIDVKSQCELTFKLNDFKEFSNEIYKKHGVILLYKDTPPKALKFTNDETELKVVNIDNSLTKNCIPANKLSPYLESLKTLKRADQLFHIFLISEDIKDNPKLIEMILDKLILFIGNHIKKVKGLSPVTNK